MQGSRRCHPFVPNLVSLCLAALNSCALNNGGCEHDCVQVTLAQHRCQCHHNHELHEDGKRCVRESPGAWGALLLLGTAGWGCSDVQQSRLGGFRVKTLCVLLSWTYPAAYSKGWEELEEGSQQK